MQTFGLPGHVIRNGARRHGLCQSLTLGPSAAPARSTAGGGPALTASR